MLKPLIREVLAKDLPDWFRVLNMGMLLLVLLWPFVFYMSIFLFDRPDSGTVSNYILFFAINAYPFYLLPVLYLNTKLFKRNRILGSVLPLIIALAAATGFLLLRFDAYL